MLPISILDLAPITVGQTAADALRNAVDLARHGEAWGYHRYWLAEHHNMTGIASAATVVVIAHVAAHTKSIRVGSGGIMLPNHAPLVVAEQFGTLESLHPGRIDLGLGRAPGTDQRTLRALRRDPAAADHFPQDVQELQAFLGPVQPGQVIRAVPGAGLAVPIWLLGSSTFSARLAAYLGLPFSFASHFAPDALMDALRLYRAEFRPSATLDRPHTMAGVPVVAAETDREAQRLFTSVQQQFANLHRGTPGPLQPPIDDIDGYWSPMEKARASHMLGCAVVGAPATVRAGLERFVEETGVDELITTSHIFDHAARLRSFEIVADLFLKPAA